MKVAYADPPYLGCCGKFYEHYHPNGHCWDKLSTHKLLIDYLTWENMDGGWALSLSATSLREILPLCPPKARVAVWAKSFCAFKRGVRPAYAWEPVIFCGGRNPEAGYPHAPPAKGGKQNTPKDFIVEPITLRKGLTGAKPFKVCLWILDLLNVQEGDEVHDLFAGTGIMKSAAEQRGARYHEVSHYI